MHFRFTDAVDSILARHYQVVNRFGWRMDSIADALTMLIGILGACFANRISYTNIF